MRLLNSCRFHTFYKILRTLKVLEKVVQFSCSQFSQTEHFIQSLFFCAPVYLTLSTAVTVIVFISIDRVRIVNHFLEIILHKSCSLFLPLDYWRTSENLSTETSRYP